MWCVVRVSVGKCGRIGNYWLGVCVWVGVVKWSGKGKGKGKVHPRTGHEGPAVEQRYSCTV
jgi:hypothetical protein